MASRHWWSSGEDEACGFTLQTANERPLPGAPMSTGVVRQWGMLDTPFWIGSWGARRLAARSLSAASGGDGENSRKKMNTRIFIQVRASRRITTLRPVFLYICVEAKYRLQCSLALTTLFSFLELLSPAMMAGGGVSGCVDQSRSPFLWCPRSRLYTLPGVEASVAGRGMIPRLLHQKVGILLSPMTSGTCQEGQGAG